MKEYIVRRLLLMVPTIFGAVTLIFLLMNILPGDIAMMILGEDTGQASPEQVARIREQLGLNRPLYVQYFSWLWGIVRLDFGNSLWTGQPVFHEIWIRLPITLTLISFSVLISAALAVPVGILAALRQDSWVDYGLRLFTISGLSIPSFWLGMLVILFLLIVFSWFPPLTYAVIYKDPWTSLQQLFLPALVLGYRQAAVSARMMRSSMLEVLKEDYVRTARAKGLMERTVVYLHALKNASLPVITIFGVEMVILFSGAVIIEKIFNVPGVGTLIVDAMGRRDIPLVQGVVLIIVGFVLIINLIVDLIYSWLDPRIRYH
ncbi:MAG: ABC transporter permease [Dehalococcoidia bacterium]|jgi:peptide/nickel transport system permease protein|nr:ABC transporter permease [Dehalococcoidia bacterium]MDP6511081.1 ABC transporter permease [Dehalococcoidia bacterium]